MAINKIRKLADAWKKQVKIKQTKEGIKYAKLGLGTKISI